MVVVLYFSVVYKVKYEIVCVECVSKYSRLCRDPLGRKETKEPLKSSTIMETFRRLYRSDKSLLNIHTAAVFPLGYNHIANKCNKCIYLQGEVGMLVCLSCNNDQDLSTTLVTLFCLILKNIDKSQIDAKKRINVLFSFLTCFCVSYKLS